MAKQQTPLGLLLRVQAGQARSLCRDVSVWLNAVGISPAPLKSVLMNATLYRDRAPAPAGDVDLLIAPSDAERANGVLEGSGGTLVQRQHHAYTWSFPQSPLLVDLHIALVSPEWFAMDTEAVLARSVESDDLVLGARTRRLDAIDVYVHLVADFAKSRRGAIYIERLRDLRQWARESALDAVVVAEALHRAGVGRAARYVLAVARRFEGDRFAGAVLDSLPTDPLGDAIAAAAVQAMGKGPVHWLTTPAAHALNRTVWSGLRSLARSVTRS